MSETEVDEFPRTITRYEEPWPHIIIDNFLPQGEFKTLTENCMYLFSGSGTQDQIEADHDDNVFRIHLRYDAFIEQNMHLHLASFQERREFDSFKNLKTFSNFVRTKPNYVHPIHAEAPFKMLSSILYLAPDANNGTTLYSSEGKADKLELEWKPNRILIFAGRDDVTWHDYSSSWNDRYTYNHFLVDDSIVERQAIKDFCI